MDEIDYNKAREFLSVLAPTCLEDNFNEWTDSTEDLEIISSKIHRILVCTFQKLESCQEDETLQEKLWLCLNCFVFNEINETLMSAVCDKFQEEDRYFLEKSKILASMNVTSEQFGGSENYAIHFSAAVVELANMDNYKSPIEKFNCLSTTYDYIFAELKSVLIDIISKYSNNEAEIPIINNNEIGPVLMVVLIKSKPVHLASNLYYIEKFLWLNQQEDHISHILESFKMAAEDLKHASEKTMRPPSGEVCRSLDLKGVIEMTSPHKNDGVPVLKEQRDRISDLIISATNELNSCYD